MSMSARKPGTACLDQAHGAETCWFRVATVRWLKGRTRGRWGRCQEASLGSRSDKHFQIIRAVAEWGGLPERW